MFSCRSEYHQKVEKALASGNRNDSLFLEIKFGMTRNEFYDHCWELNKECLVSHGPGNATVYYPLTELKHQASMNFYPHFYQEKIYQMPVIFNYDAWAPWNTELGSDSLRWDVLELMEKWYGDDFFKVEDPDGGFAHVKIDGNRRIMITKAGDRTVEVLYTDLFLDREIKNQSPQGGIASEPEENGGQQ